MNPSYQELEQRIDQCMIADRFRMRRDLKKKNERGKLIKALSRSTKLVQQRKDSLPVVSYPESLPVAQSADRLLDAIKKHQVIIVAGETGSGKTTQLPKSASMPAEVFLAGSGIPSLEGWRPERLPIALLKNWVSL